MGRLGTAIRGLGAATKTIQKASMGVVSSGAMVGGGAGIGLLSGVGAMVASQLLGKDALPEDQRENRVVDKSDSSGTISANKVKVPSSFLENIKIIDQISVDENDLRPVLGPEEDSYQRQLNEIILRIAALELKVSKQNNLVKKLDGTLKKGIQQDARQYREFDRQQDEDQIEGKNRAKDAIRNAGRKAQDIGDGIFDRLRPFLAPLAAIGTAGGLGLAANHLNRVREEGGDIKDFDFETLGNTVDRLDETVISAVSAGSGLARARSLGIVGKASLGMPTGASLNIVSRAAGGSGRAFIYLKNLQIAISTMDKLSRMANTIQKQAMQIIRRMGTWFVKLANKFGKKVVKWVFIFEAIKAMFRTTQFWIMGTISEAEWHKSNKAQINRILGLLGAPWALTMIFAIAGTAVPILGNVVGGVAGLIIGLLWGEEIYKAIGFDKLINATYDTFVFGDTSGMRQCGEQIKQFVEKKIPEMIDRMAEAAIGKVSEGIEAVLTKETYINLGSDRQATEQEIVSEYGEVNDVELIGRASEGVGTDENAILYAFRDVDTPEEYAQMKQEFETKVLPRWNEEAKDSMFVHGPHETMEEFLEAEMGGDYNNVKNQIETNIRSRKLRDQGLIDPFAGLDGEVTNTELFSRKYRDVSGVELVEDVLGTGPLDLAGSKADVFAAFRDTTFPEYNRIKKRFEERNDANLDVELYRFLGTEKGDQLTNVIRANTENKKRMLMDLDPTAMNAQDASGRTDRIPNILPIMLAGPNQNPRPTPAGSGQQSESESASPSYVTRDPFWATTNQS